MEKRKLNYYEAVAALVGTVIGAGVLGIPFVISKVGFLPGAVFIAVMTVLVVVLHLMLGEVVARTKEPLQLAGLARKYLGKRVGLLMTVIYTLTLNGVLLAYLVGGGEVLSQLLPGGTFLWGLVFFGLCSGVVVRGVGVAKHIELGLSMLMLLVIAVIMVWSLGSLNPAHIALVDTSHLLLPFGVILFALSGISAIPLLEVIDRRKRELKRAIVAGTLIPAGLYFLFALVVVGVTGSATTPVATVGLGQHIGPAMVLFGNVFALFAMSTSFILVGLALLGVYHWDLRMRPKSAALLAVTVPLVLFLLGARQFIMILGLVGSLLVSFEMILVVCMFLKVRRSAPSGAVYVGSPRVWATILILVLSIAGALGVWDWIRQ